MRISEYFLKTQKETPKEAKVISHRLLVRSGFIYQTASGSFSFLPLGYRVLEKIKQVIRAELEKAGCFEILMPVVHPERLWQESGRLQSVGLELLRAKGRQENFVLAMTHEETVTDIVRNFIRSYEDLPFIFNQFQTKFRDEPRPRGGLLRLREFIMQDAYSFDNDEKGLEENYQKIAEAYEKIFKKLDLPAIRVRAASGIMGGSVSEEFMLPSENGEDKIVLCEKCDYRANLECASSRVSAPKIKKNFEKKEEVITPKMITVSQVADFLNISSSQIIKSLLYKNLPSAEPCSPSANKTKDGLFFVLIRGDREINEAKLAQVLGEKAVLASKEDFEKADLIPGFVSPFGQKNIPVFVDHCLKHNVKYVVGGNQIDTHIVGVKLDDIKITRFVDVIEAKEEDKCTSCGANLKMQSAIELGHLFKLGTKYSTKMKALFTDRDGKKKSILMGCYGIGLDRTMAAVVETHNDENGIVWPSSVAPFRVYLMNIASSDLSQKITESVYQKLIKNNVEVLYDDRDKTAGFKFAEADLIGLPLRLTISRRSLEKSCVELKRRNQEKPELIKIDKVEKFYPF